MRGRIARLVGGLVPLSTFTWAAQGQPITLPAGAPGSALSAGSAGGAPVSAGADVRGLPEEESPGGKTEESVSTGERPLAGSAEDPAMAAAYRRLAREPGSAARLVGTLAFGQGLRLNNPYRLQTQLGETGESLSLTSPYLDLGIGATFGPADGLQHGGALRLSLGLTGVPQQALAPTYMIAYRGPGRVLGFGRLGVSVLVNPDPNVGGELGLGVGYFLTSRLALMGELVGDLFYGAATWEKQLPVYPVVSAQLGLMVDYEVLP